MPFPTPDRIERLAGYFDEFYNGRYIVWNLSEHSYDAEWFGQQVIDWINLGYPCPTLEQVLVTWQSIKAWLESDETNVAVLHCQASRCRSVVMLAVYLYINQLEEGGMLQSVGKIAQSLGISPVNLLFPSQRRLMQYVELVGNRGQPDGKKIFLQRMVVSGIPMFERDGFLRPICQLFQGDQPLFTSQTTNDEIQVVSKAEGGFQFNVSTWVEGDVLLRCRHMKQDGSRVTVFRIYLNTQFISENQQRFEKGDLDDAYIDKRVPATFQVDLYFADNEETPVPLSAEVGEVKPEEEIDRELIEKFKDELEGEEDQTDYDDYITKLEASK